MLENTFVHIKGIGRNIESALWRSGCNDWRCLLDGLSTYSVGQAAKEDVRKALVRSLQSLESGNYQYFRRTLGMKEAWRAFPQFRSSCVYLDIETDGTQGSNSVTTIGLYDGKDYQCLVKGIDLENFRDIISHYSMIVTFFGAGFDLPVLQKRFLGLRFDQIHIDLCPVLKQVGFRGGLKSIERELGIQRSEQTAGLTGRDAIFLWRRFINLRDDRALETLIAYNREDVVNLERLAEVAYAALRTQTYNESLAMAEA